MNVYESITKGLQEAIVYEEGKLKARKAKCTVNPIPEFTAQEIKAVRTELAMTQVTFAAVLGVSRKTVEAWEAGTNAPSGTARRMLSLLRTEPSIPMKYNIISR